MEFQLIHNTPTYCPGYWAFPHIGIDICKRKPFPWISVFVVFGKKCLGFRIYRDSTDIEMKNSDWIDTKNMNPILMEDDYGCCPDAQNRFNNQLQENSLPSIQDFRSFGIELSTERGTQRRYKGFLLEYTGEDPYFKVFKIGE